MARVLQNVMKNNRREQLVKEYFEKLNCNICRLFQYSGIFRYDTKRRRFVRNTLQSTLRSICVGILLTFCCVFLSYQTVTQHFLSTNETILLIVLTIYGNSMVLNVNFFNRNSYFELFKVCVEIDEFIGVRETTFMRNITHSLFRLQIVFYLIITTSTVITSVVKIRIRNTEANTVALLMITLLYGMLIYINFLLLCYIFLSMRVRFLNTALLKLYNFDEYDIFTKKTLFFDGMIWKVHYNDFVDLKWEHFENAYRLVFKVLRSMEKCLQFILLSGSCVVTAGLFLGIQFMIDHLKYDEPKNKVRVVLITLWIPLGWLLKVFIGLTVDMFLNEIATTQHICIDMMLHLHLEEKYRKIGQRIFEIVEVNSPQLSVYGMYAFNSGMVIKSITSLIVFIIMQLQYSFPSKL